VIKTPIQKRFRRLNVGAPDKILPINLIKGRFLKKISGLKAKLPIINVFSNLFVICPKIRNMNILQYSSNTTIIEINGMTNILFIIPNEIFHNGFEANDACLKK